MDWANKRLVRLVHEFEFVFRFKFVEGSLVNLVSGQEGNKQYESHYDGRIGQLVELKAMSVWFLVSVFWPIIEWHQYY